MCSEPSQKVKFRIDQRISAFVKVFGCRFWAHGLVSHGAAQLVQPCRLGRPRKNSPNAGSALRLSRLGGCCRTSARSVTQPSIFTSGLLFGLDHNPKLFRRHPRLDQKAKGPSSRADRARAILRNGAAAPTARRSAQTPAPYCRLRCSILITCRNNSFRVRCSFALKFRSKRGPDERGEIRLWFIPACLPPPNLARSLEEER
jgi:hypothetical protein